MIKKITRQAPLLQPPFSSPTPPSNSTRNRRRLSVDDADDDCCRYLNKLEAIQWENSSANVASVLGEMLSTVNNLSTELETQFDAASPDRNLHMGLQQEIQSELNEISELFVDYAERHPSICHDQATAGAIFEQLQASAGGRKPSRILWIFLGSPCAQCG